MRFLDDDSPYNELIDGVRDVVIPESHWAMVAKCIEEDERRAEELFNKLKVDDELLHRRFTI